MKPVTVSFWKYFCALAVCIALFGVSAHGQFIANPNDSIYRYLDIWEQKGYTGPLPELRPYPLRVVEAALTRVISKGNPREVELARGFLAEFGPGLLPVPGSASISNEYRRHNEEYKNRISAYASSTGSLSRLLTYSAGGGVWFEDGTSTDVYPEYADSYEATLRHEAGQTGLVPIDIGEEGMTYYGLMSGMFHFGTESMYAQAGYNRTSYGPVFGSSVIGPQAPQAAHFSFTYSADWVTYTALYMELVARLGILPNGTVYRLKSEFKMDQDLLRGYPQKALILHSLLVRPAPWLELGIFNTAVVGGRIEPTYFIPFPLPIYTQAYTQDWDNMFLGGSATVDFPLDIRWSLMVYVDDVHIERLVVFDFDTNGHKVAIQTGVSWIAPVSMPNRLSLEYLLISPYTYTHSSFQPLNYLQYTHQSKPLGSVLNPNSDQWTARLFLAPVSGVELELSYRRMRHGNGSDYGEGSIAGDGSIFDDGYVIGEGVTFKDRSSFLIQDVLERVQQLQIRADYAVSVGPSELRIGAGYMLETVQNRGLDPDAPDETNHLFTLQVSVGI